MAQATAHHITAPSIFHEPLSVALARALCAVLPRRFSARINSALIIRPMIARGWRELAVLEIEVARRGN